MNRLLSVCGIPASLALLTILAGCATTPGLGNDAGNARLPSGVTLLDSDEGECEGIVQIGGDTIEDDDEGLDSEFFVEAGENATFELEDDEEEVEWACVEDESQDVDTMRCPEGASYVRVTRAATGGEMLFECYGSDDDR